METIGERIRKLRKEKGITQTMVKEKTGISSGNMSEIENGRSLPSACALIELSRLFECTTDYILFGESQIVEITTINNDNQDAQEARLLAYYRAISKPEQDELVSIAKMKSDKELGMTNSSKSIV